MADTGSLTQEDVRAFEAAVAIANVPTLLAVLVQLTGELHWLEPPYRPRRQGGLGDNDSGGLPEDLQQEIRDAALEAILAWREGRPVAIPEPSEELLVRILSVAMDEPVPEEYGAFTAAQLNVAPFLRTEPLDLPPGFNAIVIGAGVSGICAAVNLQAAGVPFEVIERHETIGGVWLENTYPGAGVDTPNHLYAYSFAPHNWTKYFCLRDELHGYLERVAEEFNLDKYIRFDTSVERIEYDSARQVWSVDVRGADGQTDRLEANVVISAVGLFNPPIEPAIPGLAEWQGEKWHTARWPEDGVIAGKRVAIIGSGASAMQVGPEIQHDVGSLTIYQRSPQWAAPFEQFRKDVPAPVRFLFQECPLYHAWYRLRLGWTFNDRIYSDLHKDPDWEHPERSVNARNDGHRAWFTKYIVEELGDKAEELLDKALPTYPPFGKRLLMDNGWFRMLRNPNVDLVTDRIARVEGDSVITDDGVARPADVLVMATGFDVLRMVNTYETVGRSGRTLQEAWNDDDAQAYLGSVVPDFPNLFILYGPNLQAGHGGSLIFMVEMQLRYIMDMLGKMADQDIAAVEVREEVWAGYNDDVQGRHDRMVWTHPGMTTYYRNERGRIVLNSPYRNVDFFEMTREVDLDEYLTEPRRGSGEPGGIGSAATYAPEGTRP